MPLLINTEANIKLITCPKSCHWAVIKNNQTVNRSKENSPSVHHIFSSDGILISADTYEEVSAEITRRQFSDIPLTKRQQALEMYMSFPIEVRNRFDGYLSVISQLPNDADVLPAIERVPCGPDDQTYKDQLIAVLQ